MKSEWTDNEGGWGSVTVTMDDGTCYQAEIAYDADGGSVEGVTLDGHQVDMAALPAGVLNAMIDAGEEMAH